MNLLVGLLLALASAAAFGTAGALGLLDLTWAPVPVDLAGRVVPRWTAAVALGVLAAAFAYATGIAGVRLDEEPRAASAPVTADRLGTAPGD